MTKKSFFKHRTLTNQDFEAMSKQAEELCKYLKNNADYPIDQLLWVTRSLLKNPKYAEQTLGIFKSIALNPPSETTEQIEDAYAVSKVVSSVSDIPLQTRIIEAILWSTRPESNLGHIMLPLALENVQKNPDKIAATSLLHAASGKGSPNHSEQRKIDAAIKACAQEDHGHAPHRSPLFRGMRREDKRFERN